MADAIGIVFGDYAEGGLLTSPCHHNDEQEDALEAAERYGMVFLPRDSSGVPIHVGDVIESPCGMPMRVKRLDYTEEVGWTVDCGIDGRFYEHALKEGFTVVGIRSAFRDLILEAYARGSRAGRHGEVNINDIIDKAEAIIMGGK